MPGVETTYVADTWEAIRVKMAFAFDAANGRASVAGGIFPRLSNAQALAILQALRGQLNAFKIKPSTKWSLWYAALGYRTRGDKFNVSIAHGAAPAPDDVIAGVWEFLEDAAKRLDYVGAPKMLVLNFTYSAFEKSARDAYAALVAQRKSDDAAKAKTKLPVPPGIDPPDVAPPQPPDDVPLPVVPSLPSSDGTAAIVVLLLIAIALRKKRK